MKRNFPSRIVCMVCAVILAFSMIPVYFVAQAGGSSSQYIFQPDCDISVMTFNVLDYETTGEYQSSATRFNYIVDTINTYSPDLIGIQEAAMDTDFNWVTQLQSSLGGTYASRALRDDNSSYPMTIASGLMIFWKKSRFSRVSSGAAQYTGIEAYVNGQYMSDASRYYQYVKLYDSQKDINFYMFNTHLAISAVLMDGDPSTTTDDERLMGYKHKTLQIKQLVARMKSLSQNMPCFATGDYNCTFDASDPDPTSETAMLTLMGYNTPFKSAGEIAKYNFPVSYTTTIDHCFVNEKYVEVLARDFVYRDYNGQQPSDHRAVMNYMNYTPLATFGENVTYNAAEKTATATTDGTSFALPISLTPTGFTTKIYNAAGSVVTSPLTLTAPNNHFTIKFTNSNLTNNSSTVYSSIDVNIRTTAFETPGAISCENAESAWYDAENEAYHIAVASGVTSVSPVITGGSLYKNAAGTTAQSTPVSTSAGRKTLYVKIGTTVYPLYIDREQLAAAGTGTLYVDSGLTGLPNGSVGSYHDRDGIRLVTVGTNGFATLAAANSKASTNYSIYVAPGIYREGVSIYANKKLKWYGNNRDVSPITRGSSIWTLNTSRLEETILKDVNFTVTISSSATEGSVDIHGFSVVGTTERGPIYSGFGNSATLGTRHCTFNISKNILAGGATNTTNGSALWFNTNSLKDGRICDNYIGPTDEYYSTIFRATTTRNSNGLVFDNNFFFKSSYCYVNSEPTNLSVDAGYVNVTFSYNRFDECGGVYTYPGRVTSETTGNIRILYNEFYRCGYVGDTYVVGTIISQSSAEGATPTDYSKVSLTVFGNLFKYCSRGIGISRGLETVITENATKMSVNVNNNRFIYPNMRRSDRDIRIVGYMGSAANVYNVSLSAWKFNYNYFLSQGVVTTSVPADHIYDMVEDEDGTIHHYGKSITSTPYFTNQALSTLNSGSLSTLSGISASGNSYVYDGTEKSAVVTAPSGSVISYSVNGGPYSSIAPYLTDVGSVSYNYKVEKAGYKAATGSGTLTVTPATITGITMEDSTVTYNGKAKSLKLTGKLSTDTVTYSCGGTDYDAMPSFIDAGVYNISATVNRTNYNPLVLNAKLTIEGAAITGITLADGTKKYTGEDLMIAPKGTKAGDVVTYSSDGVNFAETSGIRNVGTHTLYAKVSRTNYQDLIVSSTLTVTPGDLEKSAFYVLGYHGIADGSNHTVTLYGKQTGDVITYSTDGETFGTTVPKFSAVGEHTVYVKLERPNYEPVVASAKVCLSRALSTPLFALTQADYMMTDAEGYVGRKALTFTYLLAGTGAFYSTASDVKVLSYGLLYSPSTDDLSCYVYNAQHQTSNSEYGATVREYPYRSSEEGLLKLTSSFTIRFTGIKENKSRAVVAYIRYELDGVLYEEFSTLDATTTVVDGYINGIGPTIVSNDGLDD